MCLHIQQAAFPICFPYSSFAVSCLLALMVKNKARSCSKASEDEHFSSSWEMWENICWVYVLFAEA